VHLPSIAKAKTIGVWQCLTGDGVRQPRHDFLNCSLDKSWLDLLKQLAKGDVDTPTSSRRNVSSYGLPYLAVCFLVGLFSTPSYVKVEEFLLA